jgi:hypothetical protein
MCFLPDPRSTQGVDLPQPRRSDKHYEFSKYFDMVEIPLGINLSVAKLLLIY